VSSGPRSCRQRRVVAAMALKRTAPSVPRSLEPRPRNARRVRRRVVGVRERDGVPVAGEAGEIVFQLHDAGGGAGGEVDLTRCLPKRVGRWR